MYLFIWFFAPALYVSDTKCFTAKDVFWSGSVRSTSHSWHASQKSHTLIRVKNQLFSRKISFSPLLSSNFFPCWASYKDNFPEKCCKAITEVVSIASSGPDWYPDKLRIFSHQAENTLGVTDFFFKIVFWCWPISKSLLNLLQYFFSFMFCFFGHWACRILAP